MNPQDLTAFGYRATRAADGTLTIHHVPIFVECKRGDVTFDMEWIRTAVTKAKQAEKEGYLPPLHVRHHDPKAIMPEPVRAAGFFRITGIEHITFKGEPRPAVFADLVVTDPMVREDILMKRLPYRSVEILSVADPALDSLALLDHNAPYLELPMLMIAEVNETGASAARSPIVASATFASPWRGRSVQSEEPVVACFRRGQSAHVITEDHMTTATEEKKFAKDGEDAKPADKGGKDTKGDKGGEKMADGEGGMDVKSIIKAIEDGAITVADMDAIKAAITAYESGKPETEDTTAGGPAPAAVPGGESMKKGPMDEALAKVAGENAALRARLDAREAGDQRREDVAEAMQRLDGRPLGADLKEKLIAFHKDHGPKAFAAYVDSMAKTFGTLPRTDASADAFASQANEAPAVAMTFQAAGTDAVAKATKFSREWADLNSRGMVRMSEERYVALNMERIGVKLKK